MELVQLPRPSRPHPLRKVLWDEANAMVGELLPLFNYDLEDDDEDQTRLLYRRRTQELVQNLINVVLQLQWGEAEEADVTNDSYDFNQITPGDWVEHWRSGRRGRVENKDHETKKIQIWFVDGALQWRRPAAFVIAQHRQDQNVEKDAPVQQEQDDWWVVH